MTPLFLELHRWQATPYEWGYFDCFLAPCEWVQKQCGFDPAEGIRGTYDNPKWCDAGRRMRADGEAIARRVLARLPVMDTPRPGDVALLRLPGQRHLCGALRVDDRNWAMKSEERSVVVTRVGQPVVIWGVGYEP